MRPTTCLTVLSLALGPLFIGFGCKDHTGTTVFPDAAADTKADATGDGAGSDVSNNGGAGGEGGAAGAGGEVGTGGGNGNGGAGGGGVGGSAAGGAP